MNFVLFRHKQTVIYVKSQFNLGIFTYYVVIYDINLYLCIPISYIQTGQDVDVKNGLLTDQTRRLLVSSIMERLSRYEKYKGEEIKMEQIILRQAKLLSKAFEGTEDFKPYVAKW